MTPLDLLCRWPRERRVVMLHSGRTDKRWARWSIVAEPGETVRGGVWPPPGLSRSASGAAPGAGWIGMLTYELGHAIEPAVGPAHFTTWPGYEFARVEAGFVHDALTGEWTIVGRPDRDLLGQLARPVSPEVFQLSSLAPVTPPDSYLASVARTIEYIRAGDIFQANITQPLDGELGGCPRALASAAFAQAQPWYGAYLELSDGRAVLSLSPELFLSFDPTSRRLISRPIKGTRPASLSREELAGSAKDEAELNMIVDLMRNDLGRVCEIGSIRVDEARAIETHPTVHHGVATVSGRLREGAGFEDVVGATFPAGSITGAPKIRAMQIISELEGEARGPYCGSIGWFGDDGGFTFNVAIRTMTLTPRGRESWHVRYGVGGGIVADSEPLRELEECRAKAAVLNTLTTPSGQRLPVGGPGSVR